MRFQSIIVLVFAFLSGCGDKNIAGVEVGNPELTINARFQIEGNSDTAAITEMYMNCMGMVYMDTAQVSGKLWTSTQGYMIDFADSANKMEMKDMKVYSGDWAKAEVLLNSPTGNASLPDSISFKAFSNPRYAKLMKKMGEETLHFLFEMPPKMVLKIMYDKSTLSTWRRQGGMDMEILIDGKNWMSQIGQNPPTEFRKDGLGGKYILLSPTENANTYNPLKGLLPTCFKADSTEMH